MTTIILKPKKEESLLRFHPWVFSGAISRIVLDKDYPHAEPREGDLVAVRAADGTALGVGHWQVGSIAVRILAFGTDRLPDTFWCDRIRAAFDMRRQLGLLRPDNNTFRLIHGEGDFLPGLVIDIYGDTAVIQAHSVGMHTARFQIAEALKAVTNLDNIYYKSDDTLPFKAPIQGDKVGYLSQSENPEPNTPAAHWATENGLQFRIDWLQGQKTGFFVDQRENRTLVEHYAAGRDVLNMFCYTGGFSLYALRGGARSVTSVDVSAKAVELVRANMQRNFPAATNHAEYASDAFEFLRSAPQNQYDLIILDPPAFAKHRDAVKNALRGYQRLNAQGIAAVRPGGLVFTFSCSQAVDKEMFRLAVFSAAAQTGRRVRIIHQLHQPQDHPVNIYHPEGEYLKGLVLQVE